MKQIINEIYQSPMRPELKEHIMGLGFNAEDRAILNSLMSHDADSNFHYDNTGVGRGKFERRLNSINRVVFPELIRLANYALCMHNDN